MVLRIYVFDLRARGTRYRAPFALGLFRNPVNNLYAFRAHWSRESPEWRATNLHRHRLEWIARLQSLSEWLIAYCFFHLNISFQRETMLTKKLSVRFDCCCCCCCCCPKMKKVSLKYSRFVDYICDGDYSSQISTRRARSASSCREKKKRTTWPKSADYRATGISLFFFSRALYVLWLRCTACRLRVQIPRIALRSVRLSPVRAEMCRLMGVFYSFWEEK